MIAFVKAGAAAAARETAGNPLDQRLLVDLHQDHVVEVAVGGFQHAVERLGLRHGAREAVEDEAVRGIRFGDSRRQHLDDDVVGTSRPASMIALTRVPSALPEATAARSMSPVASCTRPCVCSSRFAWVPLPAPGGPRRIRFISAVPAAAPS